MTLGASIIRAPQEPAHQLDGAAGRGHYSAIRLWVGVGGAASDELRVTPAALFYRAKPPIYTGQIDNLLGQCLGVGLPGRGRCNQVTHHDPEQGYAYGSRKSRPARTPGVPERPFPRLGSPHLLSHIVHNLFSFLFRIMLSKSVAY